MTDPAKRERAALDVLELLPERWAIGPTSYDPGTGRWTYTARGPHPDRGKYPETITGTGEDDLAAMIDLRFQFDSGGGADCHYCSGCCLIAPGAASHYECVLAVGRVTYCSDIRPTPRLSTAQRRGNANEPTVGLRLRRLFRAC